VIGDTVNVASRLERLTRELNAQIVVSDELVARVRDEGSVSDGLLDGFAQRGEEYVAGRVRPIAVWTTARQLEARNATT
jgi:adenylate cyclase